MGYVVWYMAREQKMAHAIRTSWSDENVVAYHPHCNRSGFTAFVTSVATDHSRPSSTDFDNITLLLL